VIKANGEVDRIRIAALVYFEKRLSTAQILLLNPIALTAQAGNDILVKTNGLNWFYSLAYLLDKPILSLGRRNKG
jgi:hypothetical protein